MQQDLPTIEVFDSIDRGLVRGVTLKGINLSQNSLKLNGVAGVEDDVVESARKLLLSGTFSVAQVPQVTRTNTGPEEVNFTLFLAPLNIGEVGKK